jgi:sugar lactone lactonase YvrE
MRQLYWIGAVVMLGWWLAGPAAAQDRIVTVAGGGSAGDRLPQMQAGFNAPDGIAFDSVGNMFVADFFNNRIRRIPRANGFVTTVAGTGDSGNEGDCGPGTSARLNGPRGIAFDSAGNLYIADEGNGRVRRLTAGAGGLIIGGETISPVAGDGSVDCNGNATPSVPGMDPTGLGLDVTTGNIYLADTNNSVVRMITGAGTPAVAISTIAGSAGVLGFGGDGGPPSLSLFSRPSNLIVDPAVPGNLYVADYFNGAVRYINNSSVDQMRNGVVVAAHTINSLKVNNIPESGPTALGLDGSTLYVGYSDYSNTRIDQVDASGHTTTLADAAGLRGYTGDGGLASAARVFYPAGIAVRAGTLYFGDNNDVIRQINLSTNIITRFAGNGFTGYPGTDQLAYTASLSVGDIDVDSSNGAEDVYIADSLNNRVVCVHSSGLLQVVAGIGGANDITSGDGGPATAAGLNAPSSISFKHTTQAPGLGTSGIYINDFEGHLRYVNLSSTNSVVFPSGKTIAPLAIDTLSTPGLVTTALDAAGNLYTTTSFTVQLTNMQAAPITFAGTSIPPGGTAAIGGGDGVFGTPAVDAAGNVFVSAYYESRVLRIDHASGAVTTVAGNANVAGFGGDGHAATDPGTKLNAPGGVAFDHAGNLYIADSGNQRVRKVTAPSGLITGAANEIITTVAGSGVAEYSGDTGLATAAGLNGPYTVAIDGAGRVVIGDENNGRVRRTQPPNVIAGNNGTVQATPGVSVTFGSNSTSAGSLTATASLSGPPAPLNFEISGAATQLYYDIVYTGTGGGPYTVSVFFDSQYPSCSNLSLVHYTASPPCNVGCVVEGMTCNNATHVISGTVTGFSVFAVLTADQPPVAQAIVPSAVECAGPSGAQVLLDGTGSSDPGDDIASYQWFEGQTLIATGPIATPLLSVGPHTLTLVVTDRSGLTGSTTATVEVVCGDVATCVTACFAADTSCIDAAGAVLDGCIPACNDDLACIGACQAAFQTASDGCGATATTCAAVCELPPSCLDGLQDAGETGVDCGGPCLPCAGCNDGLQDGNETGVDCGGSCAPCATGQGCNVGADCQSGLCVAGTCSTATCVTLRTDLGDSVQNQTILASMPSTNLGTYDQMQAGTSHGSAQYALLQFDLGSIPSNAAVTSAQVKLREAGSTAPGTPVRVHRITAAWSEPTVTYQSFGNAFDPTVEATFPSGNGTSLDTFALPTDLVQAWVAGTTPNDGILLESAIGHTDWNTREAGGGAGSEPEIDVCYTSP